MGQAKIRRENQERIEKILAEGLKWRENHYSLTDGAAAAGELMKAIDAYAEKPAAPAPDSPVSATGAQDFTCPHCGEWNPPYGWHYNIGDTGLFALQWITCFCGSCKTALTVNVVQFLPRPELMEKLKAQFAGKIVQA